MMYLSSKGPVAIDTMPFRYAKNALEKLRREAPERIEEIAALEKHVAALDANKDENPRVAPGDNNPPEEAPAKSDGRAAVDIHVADLLVEAKNWADGTPIANQQQADEVAKLHRMLEQAKNLVEETADAEKKPLNEALKNISDWQNGYTAKGKKTIPDGLLTNAHRATGLLTARWLQKLEDDRKAREKEAADRAAEAAKVAIAEHQQAKDSTDLEVIDRAEDSLAIAKSLLQQAEGVSRERVRVGGAGFRAVSLRTVYHAESTGEPGCWAQAYGHYKQIPEFMDEFRALIQRWADRDARIEAHRVRGVPGFNFREEKVV
ncbi:hypothetical protein C7451_106109 [Blastomonas natatoria]|uniref:Uncharacterized protein n=1 Tax=Blastomonas natatoria TaxID=34015 RepID=A0A2V3V710_9SPHN|nr:hypothetical protein [Blastomonas natatoria]PXW75945.1 hypothetical protein C7451_106109 [Blastomonas natatoria]